MQLADHGFFRVSPLAIAACLCGLLLCGGPPLLLPVEFAAAEVAATLQVIPQATGRPSAPFEGDEEGTSEGSIAAATGAEEEEDDEEEEDEENSAAAAASASHEAAAAASEVIAGARGRGHYRMFMSDPVVEEILKAQHYEALLRRAAEKETAAIIMLYSAWCPHCLAYRNTFSRLAADLQGKFLFAALNCVESSELMQICSQLEVVYIPAIKLLVPASIHRRLPLDQQKPKAINTHVRRPLWEALELHTGGVLEKFDEGDPIPFAIHTLTLPGHDLFAAVQYAARQTLQDIKNVDLPRSLGGVYLGFKELEGVPCQNERWTAEGLLPHADSAADEGEEQLSAARMHDAVRGLQFFMASWVVTVSDRLTRADEFSLIDLLELFRAVIPHRQMKRSAALAILHLYSSGGRQAGEALLPRLPQTADFSQVLQVYTQLDDALREREGQRAADWRRWVGALPFGEEAPPLPPLQEPVLQHCSTQTCSIWMLLHLLAEGAADLAHRVTEHPGCGPSHVFYKRKGQALPILLFQQQEALQNSSSSSSGGSRRPIDFEEILKVSSLSTGELIDRDPSLGCMLVPAFDVSFYIYNALNRFFGCTSCRHHFTQQFQKKLHGLDALLPPSGSLGVPAAAATTSSSAPTFAGSLRQQFRNQEEEEVAAWENRRVEEDKLGHLKLWLWRLHNSVTIRTAADSTLAALKQKQERPPLPAAAAAAGAAAANAKEEGLTNYVNCDVRWPSRKECGVCRLSDSHPPSGLISPALLMARDADPDSLQIGEEASDFNHHTVLDFLRKAYWPKAFQQD
ncbi:hypothetical protein Efla_006645 [Eimeria flavescens]